MSSRETAGTPNRSIARAHLYGATIWAYGAGGASVRPWVHSDQFSRFNGVDQ